MNTFLDRIDVLRKGTDPARAASREQDAQAVALLEQRKVVGPAVETKLRELIGIAKTLAPVSASPATPPQPVLIRHQVAQQFHAWLSDWREQARSLITRRDYQIRLGLTERRTSDDGDEDPDPSGGGSAGGVTPPPTPA